MARATWSGAVEFAGFPINVRMYPRTTSRGSQSFKTLAPNGAPVKQVLVDSDGQEVDRAACGKGVEVSKGVYHALSPDAVEMIQNAERSVTIKPELFAEPGSVDLTLSTGAFVLVPDEKVPGAEQPVSILWNGLLATKRVLVVPIVPRAGSRDSILAVHATDKALLANTLPFHIELADAPSWAPEVNEEQAQVFEQFVAATYETGPFDHKKIRSEWLDRRETAIQAALKGEAVVAPEVATATAAAPDLMAAMQASIGDAKRQTGKGGAKKEAKPKSKPKAKKAA